ncbi:DUF6313 family protein [Actinoplanes sp. NPDC051851]|uniref:DUF6313 family protein n=1 Tax=Actinoplanes sp. NPDC051851 TaxID=3154753 RepID=UPI003446EFCC
MAETIPLLQEALHSGGASNLPVGFVKYFVKLHSGDWRLAQDHWERIVEMVLKTDAVERAASGHRAIHQAVQATVSFLENMERCPLDPTSPASRRP